MSDSHDITYSETQQESLLLSKSYLNFTIIQYKTNGFGSLNSKFLPPEVKRVLWSLVTWMDIMVRRQTRSLFQCNQIYHMILNHFNLG